MACLNKLTLKIVIFPLIFAGLLKDNVSSCEDCQISTVQTQNIKPWQRTLCGEREKETF